MTRFIAVAVTRRQRVRRFAFNLLVNTVMTIAAPIIATWQIGRDVARSIRRDVYFAWREYLNVIRTDHWAELQEHKYNEGG